MIIFRFYNQNTPKRQYKLVFKTLVDCAYWDLIYNTRQVHTNSIQLEYTLPNGESRTFYLSYTRILPTRLFWVLANLRKQPIIQFEASNDWINYLKTVLKDLDRCIDRDNILMPKFEYILSHSPFKILYNLRFDHAQIFVHINSKIRFSKEYKLK